MPTLHCREIFTCDPSLAPSNRVTTNWLLTVFTTIESREETPANLTRRATLGDKPPGRLNLPASRAGRCPWCCRRHSEHKRLTFCPCGSCGRPPNVKQNAAPYPTFITNKYPSPSALSPSRRLQADRSLKSFCFSDMCVPVCVPAFTATPVSVCDSKVGRNENETYEKGTKSSSSLRFALFF